MCCYAHTGGDGVPRAADRERDVEVHDAPRCGLPAPVRTFGPDVLTLRPDAGRGVLQRMNPDLLAGDIRKGFGTRLLGCARNLGRARGFTVRKRAPRDTKEVAALLEKMRKGSGEAIRLIRDDKDELRIVRGQAADSDWDSYFVQIKPVYGMRKEVSELTKRFLKWIETAIGIGDLSDQINYEYVREMQMEMYETATANPEQFEEDDVEQFKCFIPYNEGGEATDAFAEIWKKDAAKRGDVEAFVPQTPAEGKLKEAMLRLLKVVESGFNIQSFSSLNNPLTREFDGENDDLNDGYIPFNSICTVIYEFDDFMEVYVDMLNNDFNSGYTTEYLTATEEVTPDSEINDLSLPQAFIDAIQQFILAIENGELQTAAQEAQTTK